jgi:hypothetical protein
MIRNHHILAVLQFGSIVFAFLKAGKAVLNFENEVLIMKSVTHPHLIQLEEVYENKKVLL